MIPARTLSLTVILAVLVISAAIVTGCVIHHRNQFVPFAPVSVEQLEALPVGMVVFRDGEFFIRRKHLPLPSPVVPRGQTPQR